MNRPQRQTVRRRRRPYNTENGAMFFARLAPKRDFDLTLHPLIAETLKPGSLLEIAGPPGSGKTSLLIDIAAQCIMATSSGGLSINVAYIDCDRQFHVNRLISFIQRKYAQYHRTESIPDPSIDQKELTACLERFHYVGCDSSKEYSLALELLDNVTGTPGPNRDGWILLIDMINAFYWLDRTTRIRTSVTHMHQMYSHRTSRFLGEHNVAGIVTRMAFDGPQGGMAIRTEEHGDMTSPQSQKDAISCTMDGSWKKLITNSIRLSIGKVRGKRLHRAHRGTSVVKFQVGFDGLTVVL